MRRFLSDTSPSAVLAGVIAVVIGWAGPNVLITSVQQAGGLTFGQAMSWLWGHAIFTGVAGIYLGLRTRMPLLSTWSTPGIAFLVLALPGIPFAEAVGAFLTSAVLVLLVGFIGPLHRALDRLPVHLAAALNAAILLPFAFRAIGALGELPLVVGAMMITYLVLRRLAPTWAVAAVLLVAILASALTGAWHPVAVPIGLTVPELIVPAFSLRATVSLAIPLTLLAFTGQFLPGFGVLRANGYQPDMGRVLRTCGLVSIPAALVGCHSLTLAALLANVVSGPEVSPDRDKRYPAVVWASVFGILVGLFSGTVLTAMGILPSAAVAALAGLALLAALSQSLVTAFTPVAGATPLAPAMIVAVTLSGIMPFGIGSAFWGIVAGLGIHGLDRFRPRRVSSEARPAAWPRPGFQPSSAA